MPRANARNPQPKKARSFPCSQAQRDFIEDTREKVSSNGKQFFYENDWRCITPKSGTHTSLQKKIHPESFYVRPVAMWVPHLLLEGFTPTCPHCNCKQYVNTTSVRWQNSPKILYGLDGPRYLDTVLYLCGEGGCNKRFTGYHPESIKRDMDRHGGFFNFHFSGRFAVDEGLYSFIVGCYELPSKRIYGVLEAMAVDQYFNSYHLYLHASRENKVKLDRQDTSRNDRRQLTLHGAGMNDATVPELTEAAREVNSLKGQLRSLRMARNRAESVAANNTSFKELHRVKCSRNKRVDKNAEMLPALGPLKLKQMMDSGIQNGRQLVEVDIIPQRWNRFEKQRRTFREWQDMCSRIFVARRTVVQQYEVQLEQKEEKLRKAEEKLAAERAEQEAAAANAPPPKPPLLSRINDKKGYNVRILSVARIEQILMTDFINRKSLQQSKMACLPCQILKFDFSYKLPAKIDVYTGVGKCYKPYKCMFLAQNQDNATVHWKACVGAESMVEVSHGLKQLEERNPDEVKVIYVDNCCSVRDSLLKIFKNAVVKLDMLHWMKRFEPAMHDKNSESAAQFRGMLRRCCFICDDDEFKRAAEVVKNRLLKSKKIQPHEKPPVRLVMEEARTVVPAKEQLEKLVLSLLKFCQDQDLENDQRRLAGEDPETLPKPFFKPGKTVLPRQGRRKTPKTVDDLFEDQMVHIRKDCLSDPPGIDLHKVNPKTGKIYCCRGTPSCENDNLYLDALTGKHIGPNRFDRLVNTYFEVSNHRKQMNRNGVFPLPPSKLFTHRTEQAALVNSELVSLGHNDNELPFDVSSPPKVDVSQADFGLDKPTLVESTEVNVLAQGLEEATRADRHVEDDETQQQEQPLEVHQNRNQQPELDPDEDDNSTGSLDDSDLGLDPESRRIDDTVEKLVPEIYKRESTMEAFKRLTNHQQWVPFVVGGTSITDQVEAELFDSMHERYRRNVTPSANRGYRAFMNQWNLIAATKYKAFSEGQNVTLINRKSVEQLQQYYDALQEKLKSSQRIENNNTQLIQHNQMLRDVRRDVAPVRQPVPRALPVEYPQTGPHPVGAPTVVNPQILAGGLINQPGDQRNPAPWRIGRAIPVTTRFNPMDGWNKRLWCQTCGYRKNDHTKEEKFGKPCKRDYCGKCYQRKDQHTDGKMGPWCKNEPHERRGVSHLWYEA